MPPTGAIPSPIEAVGIRNVEELDLWISQHLQEMGMG